MKFGIRVFFFFENLLRKFKFHENLTRITVTLHEAVCTIMLVSRLVILIMGNVSKL